MQGTTSACRGFRGRGLATAAATDWEGGCVHTLAERHAEGGGGGDANVQIRRGDSTRIATVAISAALVHRRDEASTRDAWKGYTVHANGSRLPCWKSHNLQLQRWSPNPGPYHNFTIAALLVGEKLRVAALQIALSKCCFPAPTNTNRSRGGQRRAPSRAPMRTATTTVAAPWWRPPPPRAPARAPVGSPRPPAPRAGHSCGGHATLPAHGASAARVATGAPAGAGARAAPPPRRANARRGAPPRRQQRGGARHGARRPTGTAAAAGMGRPLQPP